MRQPKENPVSFCALQYNLLSHNAVKHSFIAFSLPLFSRFIDALNILSSFFLLILQIFRASMNLILLGLIICI